MAQGIPPENQEGEGCGIGIPETGRGGSSINHHKPEKGFSCKQKISFIFALNIAKHL